MPQLDFNVILNNFLLVLCFFCFFYLFLSFFFLRRLFSVLLYRNLWIAKFERIDKAADNNKIKVSTACFLIFKRTMRNFKLSNVRY